MAENPSIQGTITQRQPNGDIIGIEFHGIVDKVHGPKLNTERIDMRKVGEVILEAEMHGNAGKSRIHLFLK